MLKTNLQMVVLLALGAFLAATVGAAENEPPKSAETKRGEAKNELAAEPPSKSEDKSKTSVHASDLGRVNRGDAEWLG
jgi:hypothetical protein